MKRFLRNTMRSKLEQLTDQEFQEKAEAIHQALFQSKAWKESSVIALTISRKLEIPTKPIIKRAWQEGKVVCIPKCFPETHDMHFRCFKNENELEVVYFGLLEPIMNKTELVSQEDIDFILVPGICFDRNGYRIGYGGGYYDRYLSSYRKKTASLAFQCQMIDQVPHEKHDIPVDQIFTEGVTLICKYSSSDFRT
ncbi:5-formyltetrahydrofolate cyclo-ligase [Bacillus sp. WMMC1349]|uniref:5-formyltetrahydrofolate cyclo-ligase n=1 Tax=Bacillus sp. WMMC1349 TaxID=2736254 RepID=UPI0015522AF2|nr:5-formyltetrahydrofolate cyclo-ligase [Bacillus sp. WMMC1349]NPC93313.1 5-formyltetrahydrofolate cyclo-ligase [Bacillus sp. WMMC1349]